MRLQCSHAGLVTCESRQHIHFNRFAPPEKPRRFGSERGAEGLTAAVGSGDFVRENGGQMFVAFGTTSLGGSANVRENEHHLRPWLDRYPISIESFSDSLLISTETDDDGVDARSCR